jgi:hypothetical protein
MLDWLEKFVNEHGALLLHTGDVDPKGFLGLGLRPGFLRRTLREAILGCAASDRTTAESLNRLHDDKRGSS